MQGRGAEAYGNPPLHVFENAAIVGCMLKSTFSLLSPLASALLRALELARLSR